MSNSAESTAPFWSPFGRIPRVTFIIRSVILVALAVGLLVVIGGPNSGSLGAALAMIVLAVLSYFQLLTRGRDAGWPWWATIIASLLLNGITWIALMVWPSKAD